MMKLRMGRVELLTGLQRVQGVVEKRNTMPILSNILIEAKQEGNRIEIVPGTVGVPILLANAKVAPTI